MVNKFSAVKFTDLQKAEEYIKQLGYSFLESNNYKFEKHIIYKNYKSGEMLLMSSKFDYNTVSDMAKGYQYTIQSL